VNNLFQNKESLNVDISNWDTTQEMNMARIFLVLHHPPGSDP